MVSRQKNLITNVQGLAGILHTNKAEITTKFLEYFKSRWASNPTTEGACDLVRSTIEEKISVKNNVRLCY